MVDVEQEQYWVSEAGAIGKVAFVEPNGTVWMCYQGCEEAKPIAMVEFRQTHIQIEAPVAVVA
jgi:hypothetical protein